MRQVLLFAATILLAGGPFAAQAAAPQPLRCKAVAETLVLDAGFFQGAEKARKLAFGQALLEKFQGAGTVPSSMTSDVQKSPMGDIYEEGERCSKAPRPSGAAVASAPSAPAADPSGIVLPPGATWDRVYASRPKLTELEYGMSVGRPPPQALCLSNDIVAVLSGPPPAGLGASVMARLYRLSGGPSLGEVRIGSSLGALKAYGAEPEGLAGYHPQGTFRPCVGH